MPRGHRVWCARSVTQPTLELEAVAPPVPEPEAPAPRPRRRLPLLARRLLMALPIRLLTVATGVAASIPVLRSTIDAVRGGWVPAADRAVILTRGFDVFTSHSPLVGQYSEAGTVTGHVVHSPGPMLYWLIALPARFGDATNTPLTMGIVNILAIVATVGLARRRGGLVLMFATAVAIALMCQSLDSEVFHDMWNPAAGMFPFLLLVFLCWSLACGEYRLLSLIALVASYVVQTHLMYLAPTVGLIAIGTGGLALGRIAPWLRARRAPATGGTPAGDGANGQAGAPAAPRPTRGLRSPLLWSLAALVVAALCWSAPVIDQLEHTPGNLGLVVQTAKKRGPTVGATVGWHAVVRAVGVRPWWLYVPATRWDRKYDVQATPSSRATDTTLAMLAGLGLVAILGALRRRRDVTAAALIGLAMCAALAADAAGTPRVPLLSATLGYTMWWGSVLGLWVWLVLAWSLWLGTAWTARTLAARLPDRIRAAARLPRVPPLARLAPPLGASLLALTGTALVGQAVAADSRPDEHAQEYRPITQIAARLDRLIPPKQTVNLLQGGLDWATLPIKPALRYFLVRHGDHVVAKGSYQRLGYYYELDHHRYSWIVDGADGVKPPMNGLTLAITTRFHDHWGPEVFSVWVGRVRPRVSASPSASAACAARRGCPRRR